MKEAHAGRTGNGAGPDLAMAAKTWMSPRTVGGGFTRDKGNPEAERLTLEGQAKEWATPMARDYRSGDPNRVGRFGTSAGGRNLNDEAAKWPTPTARDHKGEDLPSREGGKSLGQVSTTWPTPTAMDSEQAGGKGCIETGGRGHSLHSMASSLPQDPVIPAGPASSPPRRVLNPLFVEWLMGWPIGWTASEPAATGLSAWLQRSRGYVLTLCLPRTGQQGRLL